MVLLQSLTKLKSQLVALAPKQLTEFIRESPIVSGAALGGTALIGGSLIASSIRKRRKVTRKSKTTRRRSKRTKRKSKSRRGVIRGRGLGRSEIRHSGRGTKGTKRVSFVTASGKRVSFKVKGTSKRRKGFVKRKRR